MALLREETADYKIMNAGTNACNDLELMALIIGGQADKATAKARNLLSVVGSIRKAGRLNLADLTATGLSKKEAGRVLAAIELGRRRQSSDIDTRPKISAARDAFMCVGSLLADLNHEEFWILLLNRNNEVIERRTMFSGGQSGVLVDVKLVLKAAIEGRAAAFIAIHNHPSGSLQPSQADMDLTRRLKKSAEILEIPLLDHLIISERGYYSFAEECLL